MTSEAESIERGKEAGGWCVAVLGSIHYVLKAEALLKTLDLSHDLVPVPRQIAADCGMAVRFQERDLEQVTGLFAENHFPVQGLYRETDQGYLPLDKESLNPAGEEDG